MIEHRKMKFFGQRDIDSIPQLQKLTEEERFAAKVVAQVFPFRTNNYIVDELIDWEKAPFDPIYQLTFMQKDMLSEEQFNRLAQAMKKDFPQDEIKRIANDIRLDLNPHPAGQLTANVPSLDDDELVPGVQHKYKETCLVFPSSGQTCHAYCTFCFRWAQFVGLNDLKFATDESNRFQDYLRRNKQITDVLFTGGDPMVMSLKKLETYIEPLLNPEFEHIQNIRIGTKSVSYWPYKYVTEEDSDGILRLFEKVINAGKHLAIMAHYNHWRELSTDVAKEAIRRIRSTGAQIRSQSPLIKRINDDSEVWAKMWKEQVRFGIIPYYMFIERDTGPRDYFAVPLVRALNIFREAYKNVSGLARSVRGPSMSTTPGKIRIDGVSEIYGEKVFVLTFLQARNPDWVRRPFFARYDEKAIWLSDLKPAFGKEKFFFTDELMGMLNQNSVKSKIDREAFYKHKSA